MCCQNPPFPRSKRGNLPKSRSGPCRPGFREPLTNDYDAYYADTFPQRENFVSVATKLEQMRGLHPDDVRIHQASTPQTGIDQQSQLSSRSSRNLRSRSTMIPIPTPMRRAMVLAETAVRGNRWEAYSCIRIWECRFSVLARPCPSAMPR